MESIVNFIIASETILVGFLYLSLTVLYLLVMPALVYIAIACISVLPAHLPPR